jgi:threonine dehydrogenase-like Zn-dependent dehydrogenase
LIPTDATVVSLEAPRQLELQQRPLAPIGDADIVCETLVTAISPGTELAAYAGLPPLRKGVVYPRLQGYCNVARVLAVGSDVRTVVPGDRVLTFSSHRSHFVIPAADVLVRLPQEGRAEDLACTYLFHLGYNAILRAQVRAGSRVLVLGLGVLGLTSVAMAALAGAKVSVLSDQSAPAQIARDFGASAVYGRSDVDALLAGQQPYAADVVITTTNSWADWQSALKLCGPMGTIAVLGFPGRGEPLPTFNPLDSQSFYFKQLRIEAVGYSPEFPDTRGFNRFNERDNLAFLAEQIVLGRLQPAALVSGEYRGADITQAYEDLLARKNSAITYLLRWAA